MSVAPPVRFPTARRSEHLDPHRTLRYWYHTLHGLTHMTPAADEM
jgi:hypothetical protein